VPIDYPSSTLVGSEDMVLKTAKNPRIGKNNYNFYSDLREKVPYHADLTA
jgi:hypothetical protein